MATRILAGSLQFNFDDGSMLNYFSDNIFVDVKKYTSPYLKRICKLLKEQGQTREEYQEMNEGATFASWEYTDKQGNVFCLDADL